MPKPKKRDAAYWRGRLERDQPSFYADLIAGTYTSVRAACAAAGLIQLPNRLDALKREWRKADAVERDGFRVFLEAEFGMTIVPLPPPTTSAPSHSSGGRSVAPPPSPASAITPKPSVSTSDGKLTIDGKKRIIAMMNAKGYVKKGGALKTAPLMRALGVSNVLDTSIGRAISRSTHLEPEIIIALDEFLALHECSMSDFTA
ncbi:hypothetical protein [Paramagnetospirillum magnetotacticum]|uniref:hypothetical protein n=1 Tax=Paramagnetospirillum magnetotacticum TaxID=188 RepID=UPI00126A03A6|nr:hypothetical protein [Paramagnetospirillum magnetotacticum]